MHDDYFGNLEQYEHLTSWKESRIKIVGFPFMKMVFTLMNEMKSIAKRCKLSNPKRFVYWKVSLQGYKFLVPAY